MASILPFAIKAYSHEDRAACLVAFKSNVPAYFTVEEIKQFEDWLDYLDRGEETAYYYVVLEHAKMIGCGGFSYDDQKGGVTLTWGLIDKAYHKMGYGEKFLRYRLEQIKRLYPASKVLLETTQHTFSFFERFGFQTIKISLNFYAPGMDRYDMVLNCF